MVTDYEAAWLELQEVVAGKTQHGREQLLAAMANIAAHHRVVAGELSRLLRLYGVEVERARLMSAETQRDGDLVFVGGLDSSPDPVAPAHHRPGGHDVRAGNRGAARNGQVRG